MIGGFAGAISKTINAPLERVKLLLQTQASNNRIEKQYSGIFNCLSRCYKEEGLISLWKGNGVNVLRYFPTQALNFSFKEYFTQIFSQHEIIKSSPKKNLLVQSILAGGCAGCLSTLFVYPLDFARTRLGIDILKNKQR